VKSPDGGGTTALVENGPPVEPVPGGKALLRLLSLLDQRGLTQLEEEAIKDAVPDEDVRSVLQLAVAAGAVAPRPVARRGARARAAPPSPEASLSTEDLAREYATVVDRMGPPTGPGPQWRSLGPWTVRNGQTYGDTRVDVSGRVSALATDPSRVGHVLAGAAHGGVWESFDHGGSWSPRTDYHATLTIGALAFDPNNSRIVYCGTGEGDWWSWFGNGVLRSTDGGTTWTSVCTNPFVGHGFFSISVDPTDGRILLAGTQMGLWRSADSAVTWTRERSQRCWRVARRPGSNEILAACSDGIFVSTDGGANWTRENLPGAPGTFTRLDVSQTAAGGGVAYALGASGENALLWRREAGTWTALPSPAGVATSQAWYDWFVAAAPDSATQVYVGAIDLHRGDRTAANTWSWQNLSARFGGGESIHPDQHSCAFVTGSATIYVGNDGGVYRSPDRGNDWESCNNGLIISEFEYIAHDLGTSRKIIGGTQDNGTNLWSGTSRWDHVGDADGGDCGINRLTPTTMFHSR
jgi:hypothetical protein